MKNNKKKVIILTVILILILLIGVSYAWFIIIKKADNQNVIRVGALSIQLDDDISEGINIDGGMPRTLDEGLEGDPYSFKIINDGTIISKYTVYLDDAEIPKGKTRMNDSFVRCYLDKNNLNELNSLLSSTGINGGRVIDSGYLAPGESNFYNMRLWIDEYAMQDAMKTTFSGKIRVVAEQGDRPVPEKVTVTMPKDGKTERNFTWHMKEEGYRSDVQIIKAEQKTKTHTSFNNSDVLEYTGITLDEAQFNMYVHRAKATNLEPGVKYYYRVGDKEKGSWSPVGEFVTDNGDDKFTFLYVADQQTNVEEAPKAIYTMQKAMQKNPNAEFLLNAGDLINHPDRKEEWDSNLRFKVYGNLTSINTAGNHDYEYNAGPVPNVLNNHFYFDLDHNNTERGFYYSLNYGNTHITVLNSNTHWFSYITSEEIEWLKNDLSSPEAQNATFRIVLTHRGPYTTGTHYYGMGDVRVLTEQLTPILAEYNVDLVLQGHDHVYALSYPINEEGLAENINEATVYSTELGQNVKSMHQTTSPVYLIGGTVGTKKYEPKLSKDENNKFTVSSDTNVTVTNEELYDFTRKFQLTATPKDENGTWLAMFSSIEVNGNSLIVNSYGVDNVNYGKTTLYKSFALTR